MKKRAGITLAVGAIVGATVVAATLGGRASAAANSPASCSNVKLGMMAPLTGPAAFLGQEQKSWAQFALSRFNKQYKTKIGLLDGDTQLSADLARTVGQQFVANKKVFGVVGGSTSQSVISSAGLYKNAHLASVSGSATRADLTTGQFPTFFRVVPNDTAQSSDIANFVTAKLGAKRVTVMDSQDDYSTALAPAIVSKLEAKGVKVDKQSVSATATDFSSVVTATASDTDVFIFATQTASAAQALSEQLLAQGKKALVFGTDGAYSPSQYKPKHGYVSSFANDLHFIPSGASLVSAYNTFSHGKTFGTFGPPSYMAAWVLANAIKAACANGKATRAEVLADVRKTNVPSILGGRVRFNPKGDPLPTKFYIFEVTNGTYKNVA